VGRPAPSTPAGSSRPSGHGATGRVVHQHVVVERRVAAERDDRHVLDGELHALELARPPRLELLDRVEDEVVEALARGLRRRHPQRAARRRRR
jgi:hypothetical protein